MKRLLILSGKGGTGKTTIAAAFICLSEAKAFADCDVDAPNLHMIVSHPDVPDQEDYYGLPRARVEIDKCNGCRQCLEMCRFHAITKDESGIRVDPFACEGCGLCSLVCPHDAIAMEPALLGELQLYRGGAVFSTATLKTGSGASGKLVTEVKRRMFEAAPKAQIAVIDGSPGIGCPVIASMNGADLVLIVAEPSVSGISDLERIVKTASQFGLKTCVCINKWDTNPEKADAITSFCKGRGIPLAGRIPFDESVVRAVNAGQSITETNSAAGRAVREVYKKSMKLLTRS